jgi:hypothetical protein
MMERAAITMMLLPPYQTSKFMGLPVTNDDLMIERAGQDYPVAICN